MKREKEKLLFKLIIVSIHDMDKHEENEMKKKRRFAKNTWYNWHDWLINDTAEPMKKYWVVLKINKLKKTSNQHASKMCMVAKRN